MGRERKERTSAEGKKDERDDKMTHRDMEKKWVKGRKS